MQAVDEILEIATDFLSAYSAFTVPISPQYSERESLWPQFLEGTFKKLLLNLVDKKRKQQAYKYLVTEQISIADIIMFTHFWKLAYNPEAEQEWADKTKELIGQHPEIQIWAHKMLQDLADIFPKLKPSPF